MPLSTKQQKKSSFLKVADADSLEHFQKHAKTVWVAAHPDKHKKPGRPSDRAKIIDAIWSVEAKEGLNEIPTQGDLLRAVQKELRFPRGSDRAKETEKAIRKYAKLWLLLYKKHPTELNQSDYTFLETQAPKLHRALKNIWCVFRKYGTKKRVKKGKQEGVTYDIGKIGLQILHRNLLTIQKEQERFLPSEPLRANKKIQSKMSPRLHFQILDPFLSPK